MVSKWCNDSNAEIAPSFLWVTFLQWFSSAHDYLHILIRCPHYSIAFLHLEVESGPVKSYLYSYFDHSWFALDSKGRQRHHQHQELNCSTMTKRLRLSYEAQTKLDFSGLLFGLKSNCNAGLYLLQLKVVLKNLVKKALQDKGPVKKKFRTLTCELQAVFPFSDNFGHGLLPSLLSAILVVYFQSYDPLMLWLLPKAYWLCTLKITSLLGSDLEDSE